MNHDADLPPLHGIRVLDLSTVVAGPYGAEMLGELGADVIRIEPVAAASVPAPAPDAPISEAEGFHWALQRNKRSICIDLKQVDGRELFLGLVRKSDVVWENFRPGVTERLGIDYPRLQAVNPKLIVCSISGFGNAGPWRGVGAYDITVQALSGMMSITGSGEPDAEPCRWGVPIGDIVGSLYGVIGVLAGLEDRARTGVGQQVDIALLDAQLALNSYRVPQVFGANMTFAPASPRRGGAGTVPYGPFRCGDGEWLSLAPSSNFWRAFCAAIGQPDLADDARFRTIAERQRNQRTLDALLEQVMIARPAAEWEALFIAAKIPVGRVLDIQGAFSHPQAQARGMQVELTDRFGRHAPAAGSPLRFEGEPARAQKPPSLSGLDTFDVFRDVLDLKPERLADLQARGVIGVRTS